MSQKLRNTNTGALNFEVFMKPVKKREKPTPRTGPVKCQKDGSATAVRRSCERSTAGLTGNNANTKAKVVSTSTRPQNASKWANVAAKETNSEETLFEDTTKKKKGESWSTIFHKQAEKSTFSRFDPLRTLHFLSKELQLKVLSEYPGESHIQQIVYDMLSALKRVPPEIASTVQLHQDQENVEPKLVRSSSPSKEKDLKFLKRAVQEKACQTPRFANSDEAEIIRREMESSTTKLETSCRQLEEFCERLKSEKRDLEQRLRMEKETVMLLQKQVKDLEFDRAMRDARLNELEGERQDLALQVTKLSAAIDAQAGPTAGQLKNLIKELRAQKLEQEQECVKLRHELTLAEMEKEKYIAMLHVRERQFNEIRTEMRQLQEVVKEQLLEIQNNGFFSGLGSASTIPDHCNSGLTMVPPEDIGDNYTVSSVTTEDQNINELGKKSTTLSSFREIPSGDSSASFLQEKLTQSPKRNVHDTSPPTKDQPTRPSAKDMLENIMSTDFSQNPNIPSSLKCMFEELKREAYSVMGNLHKSIDNSED